MNPYIKYSKEMSSAKNAQGDLCRYVLKTHELLTRLHTQIETIGPGVKYETSLICKEVLEAIK